MLTLIKNILKGPIIGSLCLFMLITSLYAGDKVPITLKLIPGGIEDEQVLVGLFLAIPKDWHVYGPSPYGEDAAGFEPLIQWETSLNLQDAKVLWPTPYKTDIQDQVSYVYHGDTLIPLKLIPHKVSDPVSLNLKVTLLACSDICVPVEENLSLVLNPDEKGDPRLKAIVASEETYESFSALGLIIIAFLGGFILNFMPCVLPVLSLKVMSLIKQSKKNHISHAKQGFLITGLGIVASFALLALLTIILKTSGMAFGWGIHFQNPHFLLFVFLVLIAFSASLWGLFEIDLPSNVGNWLISHEGKGRVKDFLSGVFATLLATPCSAPFVGTALSFALAHDIKDIFGVFLFLGIGFASPYFLVSSLPPRFIRLPKPGLWMVRIQWGLGAILLLTALWIGWILSFHLPLWVLFLSTFLALIGLSLFWIKAHKDSSLRTWSFAGPLFLMARGLKIILKGIPYLP